MQQQRARRSLATGSTALPNSPAPPTSTEILSASPVESIPNARSESGMIRRRLHVSSAPTTTTSSSTASVGETSVNIVAAAVHDIRSNGASGDEIQHVVTVTSFSPASSVHSRSLITSSASITRTPVRATPSRTTVASSSHSSSSRTLHPRAASSSPSPLSRSSLSQASSLSLTPGTSTPTRTRIKAPSLSPATLGNSSSTTTTPSRHRNQNAVGTEKDSSSSSAQQQLLQQQQQHHQRRSEIYLLNHLKRVYHEKMFQVFMEEQKKETNGVATEKGFDSAIASV